MSEIEGEEAIGRGSGEADVVGKSCPVVTGYLDNGGRRWRKVVGWEKLSAQRRSER